MRTPNKITAEPAHPIAGLVIGLLSVVLLASMGALIGTSDQRTTPAVPAVYMAGTVHNGGTMNVDHVADTVAAMIHALPDKSFVSWMTHQRRTSFQFSSVDELKSIESILGYAKANDTLIVVSRFGDGWELFTEVPAAGYFYQFRMYPSVRTIMKLGLPSVPPLTSPQGSRTLFDHELMANKVAAARAAEGVMA